MHLDVLQFHNQRIVAMSTVLSAVGSLWANGNRMEGEQGGGGRGGGGGEGLEDKMKIKGQMFHSDKPQY